MSCKQRESSMDILRFAFSQSSSSAAHRIDFWTVKNVSGRILVGLRWWNEVNDQGESVWHYESLDQQTLETLNKKDSWLFWWSLYLTDSPTVITFCVPELDILLFECNFS